MADFILHKFSVLGLNPIQDGFGNVFCKMVVINHPVVLTAHLDTVEPGRGIKPSIENGIIKSAKLSYYGWTQCLRFNKYGNSATPSIKGVMLSKCGDESPANTKLQEWQYDERTGQIRSSDSPDQCLSVGNQTDQDNYNVYLKWCESPDEKNPVYGLNFLNQQFDLKSQ